MKNIFLLIVVPVLLIAWGVGQTPAPSSNADQANITGCLGGSEGNYTVAGYGGRHNSNFQNHIPAKPDFHLGHGRVRREARRTEVLQS